MRKYLIPFLFAVALGFVSCDDEDSVLSHSVLSAPTSFNAVLDSGAAAVKFSWDAVDGADYYVMYYNEPGENSYERTDKLTSTSYSFVSDSYGTTFEFKVRAEAEDAVSEFSDIVTVTIPTDWEVSLDAPTNVKAEFDASIGFIYVTWDAVPEATYYTVYYNVEGGVAYSSEYLTETQYTIVVDTYGVNYEVKVQASDGKVNSLYSETVICNIPADAEPKVPTPAVSNIREGLGWVNVTIGAVDEEYTYVVYDGATVMENWGLEYIKTNDDGSTEYSIYGLELDKTYSDIRIVALSADGTEHSNPALLGSVTTGNIWRLTNSLSPAHLSFEWDDAAANKNWTVDSSVDALTRTFQVQLAKDADFTDIVYDLYTVTNDPAGSYVTNINWVGRYTDDTGTYANALTNACFGFLDPSTTYYFRVRNSAGDSITSGTSTVTTNALFGASSWSPAISATTEPAHIPVDGELLYQGFDDHGWLGDFGNGACGIVRLTNDMSTYPQDWDGGYGLRLFKGSENNYNNLGATVSEAFPGNGETYFGDGSTSPGMYRFTGDVFPSMEGWYCGIRVYPGAGGVCIGRTSGDEEYLVTPAFDELTAATDVTISFDVSSCCPKPTTGVNFEVRIYRNSTKQLEQISLDAVPAGSCRYNEAGDMYYNCAVWYSYSHDATLNPGDYIVFYVVSASGSYEAYVDNILVVKK